MLKTLFICAIISTLAPASLNAMNINNAPENQQKKNCYSCISLNEYCDVLQFMANQPHESLDKELAKIILETNYNRFKRSEQHNFELLTNYQQQFLPNTHTQQYK
jgi:hypothetical protein